MYVFVYVLNFQRKHHGIHCRICRQARQGPQRQPVHRRCRRESARSSRLQQSTYCSLSLSQSVRTGKIATVLCPRFFMWHCSEWKEACDIVIRASSDRKHCPCPPVFLCDCFFFLYMFIMCFYTSVTFSGHRVPNPWQDMVWQGESRSRVRQSRCSQMVCSLPGQKIYLLK